MESCYIALLSICLLNKNQVVQLLLNATKFEKKFSIKSGLRWTAGRVARSLYKCAMMYRVSLCDTKTSGDLSIKKGGDLLAVPGAHSIMIWPCLLTMMKNWASDNTWQTGPAVDTKGALGGGGGGGGEHLGNPFVPIEPQKDCFSNISVGIVLQIYMYIQWRGIDRNQILIKPSINLNLW